jgi:hypothetical protein
VCFDTFSPIIIQPFVLQSTRSFQSEAHEMKVFKVIAGTLLTALGLLWAVQGADLIQIKPILCAANCEPITGGSTLWLSIGIITTAIGLALLASLKLKRRFR